MSAQNTRPRKSTNLGYFVQNFPILKKRSSIKLSSFSPTYLILSSRFSSLVAYRLWLLLFHQWTVAVENCHRTDCLLVVDVVKYSSWCLFEANIYRITNDDLRVGRLMSRYSMLQSLRIDDLDHSIWIIFVLCDIQSDVSIGRRCQASCLPCVSRVWMRDMRVARIERGKWQTRWPWSLMHRGDGRFWRFVFA